jgi:hypothetical protein
MWYSNRRRAGGWNTIGRGPEGDVNMFCPKCGAPNEDDSVFCGNCGAVLDVDAASVDVVDGEAQIPGAEPIGVLDEVEPIDLAVAGQALAEPEPPTAPRAPTPLYSPAPSSHVSGLAVASLVLGVGGLVLLPLLGSILALILGYMARRNIRQHPDELSGDGIALAGIVTGWIGVTLALLGLIAGGAILGCGLCGALGSGSW